MDKAFDVKSLQEKLQKNGAPAIEGLAEVAFKSLVEWIEESVVLTESKIDDFVIPLIEAMKPLAEKTIDQIDGKQG